MALQEKPNFQDHPEEIGLHAATYEFRKMKEPKISKLKGGYISARLVFQSWLKDICVHTQDWRLTQREAVQLVKDFTTEHAWDRVEFYMGIVAEDQSFQGLIEHLWDAFQSGKTLKWVDQWLLWPVWKSSGDQGHLHWWSAGIGQKDHCV